jgi:hypothetical protein
MMMVQNWIAIAKRELGVLGMAALAVIVAALALETLSVGPMQQKSEELDGQVARQVERARAADARLQRDAAPATKLAAFYRFFENGATPTASLARLNAIARSAGVEMRSADYRVQNGGSRIERYEITLPLAGSYSQIRAFLEQALEQIPVLSLDQVDFKRKSSSEARVQAEARLSLHMLAGGVK